MQNVIPVHDGRCCDIFNESRPMHWPRLTHSPLHTFAKVNEFSLIVHSHKPIWIVQSWERMFISVSWLKFSSMNLEMATTFQRNWEENTMTLNVTCHHPHMTTIYWRWTLKMDGMQYYCICSSKRYAQDPINVSFLKRRNECTYLICKVIGSKTKPESNILYFN